MSQWTYTCGNSWGACPGGGARVGCGAQETFRACSDIRILDTWGSGAGEHVNHDDKQKHLHMKNSHKDKRRKIKVIRKKIIGVKNFKPYLLSVITLNERKSNRDLKRNTFKESTKKYKQIKTNLQDYETIENLISTIRTCKAVGKILQIRRMV